MRLSRAPSIVSLLATLTVLSTGATGCRSGESAGNAGAPSASAPPLRSAPVVQSAPPPLPGPEAPFKAKIAENLSKVPDPVVLEPEGEAAAPPDNAAFRDRVVSFARHVAAGEAEVRCELSLASKRAFVAHVWAFEKGQVIGAGEGKSEKLCAALEDATRRAVAATGGDKDAFARARLVIELPEHFEAMTEYEGRGVELTHGLVPVRSFDAKLLDKRIAESSAYLMRVIDPEKKGVHKYYHAPEDVFERKLHTIYTASTALTLLRLNGAKKDDKLVAKAEELTTFMLSMQSHDEANHTDGGFFYSFDLETGKHDDKLVVGTTSKSIFTLVELHAATGKKKYLDDAKTAANWLITMQRPDGTVRSYLEVHEGGKPTVSKKESMLYTGQVLSALSRVARATKDTKYLDAAAPTAAYLLARATRDKTCWLGDEYRKPNPISTSWVILSLLDFVRATGDEETERGMFRCADSLLGRQWRAPEDAYRHGRFRGSLSSSGSGWLAEVYSEVFMHCKEKGRKDCDKYKDVVLLAIRQALMHTYTPENDFVVKNPAIADGGIFWSRQDRYVRTDAVCHGLNAYVAIRPHVGDGVLFELPERPLAEQMALDLASVHEARRDEPKEDDDADDDDDGDGRRSSGSNAAPMGGPAMGGPGMGPRGPRRPHMRRPRRPRPDEPMGPPPGAPPP